MYYNQFGTRGAMQAMQSMMPPQMQRPQFPQMPQMDPNMARQIALQRMQQQRQGPSPMPQQGQSFGPQDMNQVGAQGGMSPAMQNMRNLDFKGIQQAFNQGPQNTSGFSNPTSMQEIGRQMGFDPAAGDAAFARLSPEQQQRFKQSWGGGLMGMMGQGQQPSAAIGSQMGASQSNMAQANQQAMAQQAPAQQPRRNPYGMSMDMMARMNPNAARYYGGR